MAKAPLSQTVFLTEDGSSLTAAAVDIPPLDLAPTNPAPSFPEAPSIEGSPIVGQVLTGNDGTILNGTVVSRRWVLGGVAVSTSQLYTAAAAGALVYEVTARGLGGDTTAASSAVQVKSANPTPTPTPSAKMSQQGWNLAGDGLGNPSFLFLNRMKTAVYGDVVWNNSAPVSAYDYPISLRAGASDTATKISIRKPASGRLNYVLRHNGSADFQYQLKFIPGLEIVSGAGTNRCVFSVPAGSENQLGVVLVGGTRFPDTNLANSRTSMDAATQLEGIVIVEESLEALYCSGKDFHPAAVQEYADTAFSLRFMDAMKVNNSLTTSSMMRAKEYACSYNQLSSTYGFPLETAVRLCNEAKVGLWFPMHHAADASYQIWAFSHIRDNLDLTLPFQLEYSNEVWNPGFHGQYNYAAQEGGGDAHIGYGRLAAKMMIKAREVFGAQSGRILGQFGRQAGVPYSFTQAALGVEQIEGKKVRDYFEALTIGFYLNGGAQELNEQAATAGGGTSNAAYAAAMNEVALFEGTGVVRQQFVDQMRYGVAIAGWPNTGTLDQLAGIIQDGADFCRAQGIKHLTGYEGQNWHSQMSALGADAGNRFNTMMAAGANDPRVSGTQAGSFMRDQHAMMRAKGMTNAMVLTDTGTVDLFGAWRTKPDLLGEDTALWSFYEWYQQHAEPVAFEMIVTGGGLNMSLGAATSRRVTTFGGAMPAGAVTLASGAIPGMTFADGLLSGTPTTAGTYELLFSAFDATGLPVSSSQTFTVKAQANYRYVRVWPVTNLEGNVPGSQFFRYGTSENTLRNGSAPIAASDLTASSPAGYSSNVPARIVDGSTASDFITDGGQPAEVCYHVLDAGAGEGVKPTSIDIYPCTAASGFSIGSVMIDISRDGATWTKVTGSSPVTLVYNNGVANVPFVYLA